MAGNWKRQSLAHRCRIIVAAGAVIGLGGCAGGSDAKGVADDAFLVRRTTPANYDRSYNNVYYKVPEGYIAAQGYLKIIMLRKIDVAASNSDAALYIFDGRDLNEPRYARLRDDLTTNRGKAVKGLAFLDDCLSEEEWAGPDQPRLVNDPARDGYEIYLVRQKPAMQANGLLGFSECAVILTGDRAEIVARGGVNSREHFDALEPGFRELLASLAFQNAGAPTPLQAPAPLPTEIHAEDARP